MANMLIEIFSSVKSLPDLSVHSCVCINGSTCKTQMVYYLKHTYKNNSLSLCLCLSLCRGNGI